MAEHRLISTGDDEADNANLSSIMALAGGVVTGDVTARLAELLRSEYQLTPTLRRILADALDGSSDEIRLTLGRNGKRGPRRTVPPAIKEIGDFLQKLTWGQFITSHAEYTVKVENAVQDACDHFDIQRSQAYEGLAAWKAMKALEESSGFGQTLGQATC